MPGGKLATQPRSSSAPRGTPLDSWPSQGPQTPSTMSESRSRAPSFRGAADANGVGQSENAVRPRVLRPRAIEHRSSGSSNSQFRVSDGKGARGYELPMTSGPFSATLSRRHPGTRRELSTTAAAGDASLAAIESQLSAAIQARAYTFKVVTPFDHKCAPAKRLPPPGQYKPI